MLIVVISALIALGLSWGIATLLVWLICLCFGWTFSILVGTGVWLIMLLVSWAVKPTEPSKPIYSIREKR